MTPNLCRCNSGNPDTTCCQPFLDGQALPQTPEQLMRSRYSAFCQGQIDYLIATHHPSQRQGDERQTLAQTIATTQWVGLKVLHSAQRGENGQVEFVAFYQRIGVVEQLHEKSEFVREAGRWFYLTGEILPPVTIGRNEPCWCGSGRKYKQCHGR